MLLQPVDHDLDDDFDFIYTWKDERFRLNVGLIIAHDGRIGSIFFEEWTRRIEEILQDENRLEEATRKNGAADQHALGEMIGHEIGRGVTRSTVILAPAK